MMNAQDQNIVRRARLSKTAIGLAMALTLAAVVAVISGSVGHPGEFAVEGPISEAAADQPK